MASTMGLVTALFTAGLLGSMGHCLGMCGPLLIVAGTGYPRQGVRAVPYHLLYLIAKMAVYVLLGLLAGWVGSLFLEKGGPFQIPAAISIVLGIAVIVSGLAFTGVLHVANAGWLGSLWSRAVRAIKNIGGSKRALALGALNGLLPCGLVYSALLIAAGAGTAWKGGLGMLAFGLGTMPGLLLVGLGAGLLTLSARRALAWTAGLFIVLVGIQLVLRGLASLGVIPHMMLGMVMFW